MLNKVLLIGRVGRKTYKQIKNGSYMTRLGLSTFKKKADAMGHETELTCWHNVMFYGKFAEIANQIAEEGSMVYVEGEIQNSTKKEENGESSFFHCIVANEIRALSYANGNRQNTHPNSKGNVLQKDETDLEEDDESGIPF